MIITTHDANKIACRCAAGCQVDLLPLIGALKRHFQKRHRGEFEDATGDG